MQQIQSLVSDQLRVLSATANERLNPETDYSAAVKLIQQAIDDGKSPADGKAGLPLPSPESIQQAAKEQSVVDRLLDQLHGG